MTATSFIEMGGASRPSVTRTVLVVSSNGDVRSGWATYFERLGMRTRRCVGPAVSCALLGGLSHCPLQDEADLAVYERESCTPEFRERLLQIARLIPFAVAADHITAAGQHEPFLVEVISSTQRANG